MAEGKFNLISAPKGTRVHSHSLYADDVMVFCRGDSKNLKKTLMSILEEYNANSGQYINKAKSKIYFGKGAMQRKAAIAQILGMSTDDAPFNYLGVPIFKGHPKKFHLQPIVDKVRNRMEGWVGRLMSMAGRAELIKSVIIPMFLHSFHVYAWPKMLLDTVQKWMRNILWSGDILVHKTVKCCLA